MPTRTPARAALAVYLAIVAVIVFVPVDDDGPTGIVARLARVLAGAGVPFEPAVVAIDFVANIALFVPFGVLAAASFPGAVPAAIVAAAAATSTAIELVQLALPTRVPTWTDVVANTAGAALGLLLLSARRRHPSVRARSRGGAPSRAGRDR